MAVCRRPPRAARAASIVLPTPAGGRAVGWWRCRGNACWRARRPTVCRVRVTRQSRTPPASTRRAGWRSANRPAGRPASAASTSTCRSLSRKAIVDAGQPRRRGALTSANSASVNIGQGPPRPAAVLNAASVDGGPAIYLYTSDPTLTRWGISAIAVIDGSDTSRPRRTSHTPGKSGRFSASPTAWLRSGAANPPPGEFL